MYVSVQSGINTYGLVANVEKLGTLKYTKFYYFYMIKTVATVEHIPMPETRLL